MEPSDRNSQMPRRSFLDWLLGLGAFGFLASAAYPILKFLKPLPSAGATGPVRLEAEELQKLGSDGFVIVRAGTKRVIVFEDLNEKLRCLDAKCTHEGCTVQYVSGESMVWCACHNGRFDLDGRVLSGPPPRPLDGFGIHRDGDDVVLTMERV